MHLALFSRQLAGGIFAASSSSSVESLSFAFVLKQSCMVDRVSVQWQSPAAASLPLSKAYTKCDSGASLGHKEMAGVSEWGVPLPGLPRKHHQPLWQRQPAQLAAPAVTLAH